MVDESAEARSAGRRQVERLHGKDSQAIVRGTKELASTWRVYVRDWQMDSRHPTQEEAEAYVVDKYWERLLGGDVKYEPDHWSESIAVWTRRWTVQAEWKHEQVAREWASVLTREGKEVEVVARNSRREHVLRSYGVLKLPS